MKLIADSGNTKTEWCMEQQGKVCGVVRTQGINPFHQDDAAITDVLVRELLPQMKENRFESVHFYGSGVTPEMKVRVGRLLSSALNAYLEEADGSASNVEVESDLTGAARSLFGREEGIACILGTGSNSGVYDGHRMTDHTPALGYILGDEGSGADLGKTLVNRILKRQLPDDVCTLFIQETGLTEAAVTDRVYRQPNGGRFLASLTPFISRHMEEYDDLRYIVRDRFREFFHCNLEPYHHHNLRVRAIGSIAYVFQEELMRTARDEGFLLDVVSQTPMEGLVRYHG